MGTVLGVVQCLAAQGIPLCHRASKIVSLLKRFNAISTALDHPLPLPSGLARILATFLRCPYNGSIQSNNYPIRVGRMCVTQFYPSLIFLLFRPHPTEHSKVMISEELETTKFHTLEILTQYLLKLFTCIVIVNLEIKV